MLDGEFVFQFRWPCDRLDLELIDHARYTYTNLMPDEFRYEKDGYLEVYRTRSYRSGDIVNGIVLQRWAKDQMSGLLQRAVQDLAKFVPLPQQRAVQQILKSHC